MIPPFSTVNAVEGMIKEGDFVILFERFDKMHFATVKTGERLQNRFGTFRHDDMIGKAYGTRVKAHTKGSMGLGFLFVLPPTPELWTIALPHRTQILYSADISLIISTLDLCPGSVVVESGTGSGSLSSSIARAIAPHGHLHTFEFNQMRVEKAKSDFQLTGVDSVCTVTQRNVLSAGFSTEETPLDGVADAVFLDLPSPWDAVEHAAKVLKKGGRLCNFSPCIEQVQRASEMLRQKSFVDVRTFECLTKTYDVKRNIPEAKKGGGKGKKRERGDQGADGKSEGRIVTKPYAEMKGHTGYLTFALYLGGKSSASST